MMFRSSLTFGTIISLSGLMAAITASAQSQIDFDPDVIRIEAGQMLEVGTDTDVTKPDYSWILTKDRVFQNAQRTKFFQTRPAQTGVYSLDISIQDSVGVRNEYRAFKVVVTEPTVLPPLQSSSGSTPLKALLRTTPAAMNGTVYLAPEGGMLRIDASPSLGKITSYNLDLDSTVDADGNGNSTDDHDNQKTYSEQTGSPIAFFVLPSHSKRSMTLAVTNAATGLTDRTSIAISFDPPPAGATSEPLSDPNSPIRISGSDSTAVLSATLPEGLVAGKQLLYQWDFGDRSKSLLTSPSHTYAAAGTYTISLTVLDITTGQIVFQGTNAVQITTNQQPVSSSSSSASSTEATAPDKSGSTMGSLLTVGFIILLLIGLAIGLYMAAMWVKRKTTVSLEKTIEHMEKTLVKKEVVDSTTVEPLKLRKDKPATSPAIAPPATDAISEREKSKKEFTGTTRDNPVPVNASAPVPDWLAKASSTPASTSPKASAPAPQSPKAPSPALAPKAPPTAPPAPPPKPQPTAPLPPKAQPAPAPVTQPKPQTDVPVKAPSPPVAPPKAQPVAAAKSAETTPQKIIQAPAAASVPAVQKQAVPAPKPVTPSIQKEQPKPIPMAESRPSAIQKKSKDDDQTIAIIQADSLTK